VISIWYQIYIKPGLFKIFLGERFERHYQR